MGVFLGLKRGPEPLCDAGDRGQWLGSLGPAPLRPHDTHQVKPVRWPGGPGLHALEFLDTAHLDLTRHPDMPSLRHFGVKRILQENRGSENLNNSPIVSGKDPQRWLRPGHHDFVFLFLFFQKFSRERQTSFPALYPDTQINRPRGRAWVMRSPASWRGMGLRADSVCSAALLTWCRH